MANRKKLNRNLFILKKYLIIMIGAILMGVSVNFIFEPMELVTGGVAGLAIVAKELSARFVDGGIPVWLFTAVVNVPLFLMATKIRGGRFLLSSLFGTVVYTLAMLLLPIVDLQLEDYLLASILGGAIGGMGIGLVFSVQGSTGGTDLAAYILQHKNKHMSVPQLLIFVDGIIILLGAVTFGIGNALYALISIFIATKVSDGILEGLKFAKMAYVISDHYKDIADAILLQMDRGVTGISATGMYSNKDKKMLFCVVSKKEIIKIVDIAKKIDPDSFVIVTDVREVMGEGFIEFRQ